MRTKNTTFKTNTQNLGLYALTTYQGDLDSDSFLYPLDDSEVINYNYVHHHWQQEKYMNFLVKKIDSNICPRIVEIFKDNKMNCTVSCQSYYSPREYNFGGDCFNLDFDITPTFLNRLLVYINANYTALNKYLYEHFTSRDGFISFTANNCQDVISEIKDLIIKIKSGSDSIDSRELSAVMSFILSDNEIDLEMQSECSILEFVDEKDIESFRQDFVNGNYYSSLYKSIDSEMELNLVTQIISDYYNDYILRNYNRFTVSDLNLVLQNNFCGIDYDFTPIIQRTFAEIDSKTMEIAFN